MKKIVCLMMVLLVGVGFKVFAGDIKEGQWSMTMKIQMSGANEEMAQAQKEMEHMSAEEKAMMQKMMGNMGVDMNGQGMTITHKQCMTNEHPVPQQDEQERCEETHTTNGNSIHFEVTCKNNHSVGDVTYSGDSMKGTIRSTQTERGHTEESVIDLKGQYVGPCTEEKEASKSGVRGAFGGLKKGLFGK